MFPLFIRSLKFLIGGAFVFVLGLALFGTISTMINEPEKETAEHAMHKLDARNRVHAVAQALRTGLID